MTQKHLRLRQFSWFVFKLLGIIWFITIIVTFYFQHLPQLADDTAETIISIFPVIMAVCLITIMSSKLIERFSR